MVNDLNDSGDSAPLLECLVPICREAGRLIMAVYASDFEVRNKDDSSPVTEADERAEKSIVKALRKLRPSIPIIAEEEAAAGSKVEVNHTFWLVDPLDGTKEFISRNGEFTVNVALIHRSVPVLGVVYAPALDRLFAGGPQLGSWIEVQGRRRPIETRPVPPSGLSVVASRSHGDTALLDRFLAGRKTDRVVNAGSSLKFCVVAAGEADVYPRFGRTMEWDIAAGQAVLCGAGGAVTTVEGAPMLYGKPQFENPHFIAWGHPQTA
jgi:3'(2'), 5'-bisphosphate nucleotidase